MLVSQLWPPLEYESPIVNDGFLPLLLHTFLFALIKKKCFNVSKPQIPHCSVHIINGTCSQGYCEENV